MKKTFFILFPFLVLSFVSSGQTSNPVPQVYQPVYFDVSPPLREIAANPPRKADLSWKDGIVKNMINFRKYHESGTVAKSTVDPVLQSAKGVLTTDTTIQNFEGNDNTQGYLPPDVYGEVGPNHYFQVVNCHFSIFDKTGNLLLGPLDNSSIWNGMPNNNNSGDGTITYDEQADRWVFSQLSFASSSSGPYYQMIAVSQTSDPTGSWYRYEYQFTDLNDYPKFGVWRDGYYMTVNNFTAGATWNGVTVAALDRSSMLQGLSNAQMITFTTEASNEASSLLPFDCDGTFPPVGTPEYFVYYNENPSHLGLYEFHVDWNTPSSSTFGNFKTLNVASFSSNFGDVPQKGTSRKLDNLSDRLMYRAQYRYFSDHQSMVVNHSVVAGVASGIRWYELRRTSGDWSLYQQATYAPNDSNYRWMGSIAMDTKGDIALGFTVSSTKMYPTIRYTGRSSQDPLGQMTVAEKGIMNGGGSQTSSSQRWGDYSGMTIDPTTDSVFWYTHEYYSSTSSSSWKTRIASFCFTFPLAINAKANPSVICPGKTSTLTANPSGGSWNYTYLWTSNPPGFTDTIPNPVVSPTDTTWYYVTVSDGRTSQTDSVRVNVRPLPSISAGNDTLVCWYVTEVNLNGTATNYASLVWSTSGDGTFSDNHALQTIYYPGSGDKTTGSFTVTLTAYPNLPCNTPVYSSKTVTFDACTGIPPVNRDLSVVIQPNPSHGLFNLTVNGLTDKIINVQLVDMTGKIMYSSDYTSNDTKFSRTIDLSGLAKNIYFLKITSNNRSSVSKIVIN
ncbi:MAG: T9SS type A sorting domain-containing protein [Bacteroidota bacterium]|nr:T9SS type A sorting domain-containing protein [Bacteroidota bacterium]